MTVSKRDTDPSRNNLKEHDPCYKFIWNKYLLASIDSIAHPDWILPVIHGFVAQSGEYDIST